MAKENSLIYKKSKQYQLKEEEQPIVDIVEEALKQVVNNSNINIMKKKKKKKDTIVKLNCNYTEIELLPLNNGSSSSRRNFVLYKYDDDDDEFVINREYLKLNRKKYFENLRRLMQNNFAILFLFFLCALPVSIS